MAVKLSIFKEVQTMLLKALLLLAFFLIISCRICSQINATSDSLITEICKTLIANKYKADTASLMEISSKYIYPVIMKTDSSNPEDLFKYFVIRLQRNCNEFKLLCERMNPGKGDWVHENSKPVSYLDKKACKDFAKIKHYYYLEASGDTTHLTIANNFWEDHLKDGTYSKLKFYWTGDCEFEIEFVESNNEIRRSFSRPGDRYRYQILEKYNGYYKLSAEIVGQGQFYTFKMYY